MAYLAHPARLIVSELVSIADLHAGTDLDVWVSVRGAALHLAVYRTAAGIFRECATGVLPHSRNREWDCGW